jgi:pimeloyl-ACP methyl ester carboxylesterase
MTRHASTFLLELSDPAADYIARADLAAINCPVLLTAGTESPPLFAPVVAALSEAIPDADVHRFEGAGHAPHATHPSDFVATVAEFVSLAGNPSPLAARA